MAEVKVYESYVGCDSELEPERGRQIIDAESNSTIATTNLQLGKLDEIEEGEHLFHS